MWILNICLFTSGALILYFAKLILRIQKKLESIINIFIFFIKISCKAKNPPFLDNTPLSPTPPFLQKIFDPHSYCQIRGTKSLPL